MMSSSRTRQLRSGSLTGERTGAMMILILVLMVGFMVTLSFSVDVAYMHLTRTEIRTATDAAAKAAASELSASQDLDAAILRGQQIAAQNTVGGKPLRIAESDFVFGYARQRANGRFRFLANDPRTNSVQVLGHRTSESPDGEVPLFFGNIFGVDSFAPRAQAVATFVERDVVLVVDRSGSMEGQRFDDLVGALHVFVETLEETPIEEKVGLASYSELATEDVQLTSVLSEITDTAAGLSIGGSTSVSRGIFAGASILHNGRDSNFVERTLIVMTDGMHNRGPDPEVIASQIAGQGITIHAITFGSGADQIRMRNVADIGRGHHYHALDATDLREAYREIALSLSTIMTE